MSLRKLLLAATVLALPAAAEAQQVRGIYVGGSVGGNWMEDSDITTQLGPRSGTGSASFHDGYVLLGNVGWGFGNGIRAEFELNYRNNEVSDVTMSNSGFGASRDRGTVFSWGAMVNGYYDFNLPGWPVQPYVGAGIGLMNQNWDNVRYSNAANGANFIHVVGTNSVLAYQLILGLAVPFSPSLALTAEYRALGALDGDRDAYFYPGNGGARTVGSADTSNGIQQSLLIGLRYNFGQRSAPPAPAPAAAPAPARTYLVFFDWDRYNLTDRARQIIGEAANASRSTQTTRIEVAGHADRSGTPQYNQRLSQRRADAVAAELERQGVPRSAMVVQAFGESRPLVPTADGVREPQNRRVEIVLR
jgi:outer membrane protein OmpA-like peptidoglycan-associated protein